MSMAAIGSTIVGGVIASNSGGGGGGQAQTQSTSADPFQTDSGLFSAGWDGSALNLGVSDPKLQQILQQVLGGAGGMFQQANTSPTAMLARNSGLDFLNQAGETDPYQIAESQFNLMHPLLQKQFDQDYLNLESRQFSQGRLGSTPGAQDMEALFNSQNDARTKLLFDSLQQGMGTQQHLYNMGSNFAQLDPALRGSYQNLGTGFLNIPLQLQQAMLNQAQVGGGVAGSNTVGSLTDTGFDPLNTIGTGLMTSGTQGISNQLNEMFKSPSAPPNYYRGDGTTGGGR